MESREIQDVIGELRALPDGEDTAVEIEGLTIERAGAGMLQVRGATAGGLPMVGECFDPARTPVEGFPDDVPFLPDVEITTMRIGPDQRVSVFITGPESVELLAAESRAAGWRDDGQRGAQGGAAGGVEGVPLREDGSPEEPGPVRMIRLERDGRERRIWRSPLPGSAPFVMIHDGPSASSRADG